MLVKELREEMHQIREEMKQMREDLLSTVRSEIDQLLGTGPEEEYETLDEEGNMVPESPRQR